MAFSDKSVLFDGVDEYVTMGDILSFERTDAFSITCWVKTTGSGTATIVGKMEGGTTQRGYQLIRDSSNYLRFILRNDEAGANSLQVRNNDNSDWRDGYWQHICVTYDGSSSVSGVNFYRNGRLIPKTTIIDSLTATISTTAEFRIGRRGDDTEPFGGNVDDVAIYSKELSAAEVAWVWNAGFPRDLAGAGAPSDLAGWWRMGDGDTYPILQNSAGDAYSPLTKAINFNEGGVISDQILNLGNPLDSVTQNDPFSACLWVNSTSATGGMLFTKYSGGTPNGWYVRDAGSGTLEVLFRWGPTSSNVYKQFASTGVSDGSWHFLMLTYDGSANVSGIKLYMDGAELTPTTTSGTTINGSIATTSAFGVGVAQNSGLYYTYVGLFLHCAAWTTELTPAEVATVYGGGLPQDLLIVGPTTDLAFWHSLGDGNTHANPGGVPDLSGNGHDAAWWQSDGGFSTNVPSLNGTMVNMESGDIVDDASTAVATNTLNPDLSTVMDTTGIYWYYEINTLNPIVPSVASKKYKMRARDSGAAPPGFVTWVYEGVADYGGLGYSGGTPTPIGAMVPGSAVVIDEWR